MGAVHSVVVTGSPSLNWQESWQPAEVCPECESEIKGPFCANCGQKQLKHRLNFYELFCDLLSRITSLERGLLFTFFQVCRRPGVVAKEYVLGRQKRYANPLTYFFLSVAAQLTVVWIYQAPLRESLTQQFRDQPDKAAIEKLEKMFDGHAVDILLDAYFSAIQQTYLYCAFLFFCFPFSLLVLWGQHWLGQRFTWGETTVFTLYIFGQALLLSAILSLFTSRMDMSLQLLLMLAVMIFLPQQGHTGFFPPGWLSRFITFVATMVSFVLLMLSFTAIFTIAVMWAVAIRVQ